MLTPEININCNLELGMQLLQKWTIHIGVDCAKEAYRYENKKLRKRHVCFERVEGLEKPFAQNYVTGFTGIVGSLFPIGHKQMVIGVAYVFWVVVIGRTP